MDWKLYVLGLMLIISWVAQGVGLFTPHWMTKDGQSRGILPWHSGDSGWIKAATFELYIAFLVFIPAIGCYMIAVSSHFKHNGFQCSGEEIRDWLFARVLFRICNTLFNRLDDFNVFGKRFSLLQSDTTYRCLTSC
ncbi:hypothetical protein L5515_009337 [Caenorhabditis briggsae]|uniref:Uncharacterized protein n=1 Tax=Caenorhabditis briggsae TaxID=6238 RepID=A0AAE9F9M7_CAEBR|nr:hypothetical protein L5515_009337 [Caenorhabditis briggsae]